MFIVIIHVDCSDYNVFGVYSTMEKARRAIEYTLDQLSYVRGYEYDDEDEHYFVTLKTGYEFWTIHKICLDEEYTNGLIQEGEN